jgi:HEAT repeat protein/type II secretion system (T2SS) protein E
VTLALAKYLVDHNLVSPGQMDDILQRQVVFGGSVDTNVLELGLLDEQILTQALSAIHRLPVATRELLSKRDPRMINLFPARLAKKHQVVPVTMSGRSAFVLSSARIHPLVIEEIGFMLSLAVKTHMVCEARLQGFLQKWFRVEIEPRYSVLVDRLGKFDIKPDQATPDKSETQISEEELPAASGQAPAIDRAKVEKVLDHIRAADRKELAMREKARSGRITLREATRICMQANQRDEIIDSTLRFARQFSSYVALFIVNDDSILGWDAVGGDNASETIKKVRVSAGRSSVLTTVLQTRAYYLGAIPESVGNNELLQAIERPRPRNVFVVPITLKNRLVGLLYGDSGQRPIRGGRLVELLVFTSRLSSAFEQLILKIKEAAKSEIATLVTEESQPSQPRSGVLEFAELAALQSLEAAGLATPDGEDTHKKPDEKLSPKTAVDLLLESTAQTVDSAPPPVPEEEPAEEPEEVESQEDPQPQAQEPEESLRDPAYLDAPEDSDPASEDLAGDQGPPPAEPPAVDVEDSVDPAAPATNQTVKPGSDFPIPPPTIETPVMLDQFDDEPMVVDENFIETKQVPASSDSASFEIPSAARNPSSVGIQEGEKRVKFEDLPDDTGEMLVVDAGDDVVIVDTEAGFIPDYNETEQEALPVISSYPRSTSSEIPPPEEPVILMEQNTDSQPTSVGRESTVVVEDQDDPAPESQPSTQPSVEELCADLVSGDPERATQAGSALVSIGPAALESIMKHFPGDLLFDIRGSNDSIPPLNEHSELLRCLVEIGADAGEAISQKLEDPNPRIRYYAVRLLADIYCPRFVPDLAKRLYDRDALIRLTTVDTLHAYRKTTAFDKLLADLRANLKSDEPNKQAIAAALLGNFKDCDALPSLATLVKSKMKMVSRAAIESLSFITKQNFGSSERKWIKWWKTHKGERRIQWLIAGLSSKNRDIRFSSAQELTQATQEYFGYYFDSSKNDREKAIRRWEKWWNDKGRRMNFDD